MYRIPPPPGIEDDYIAVFEEAIFGFAITAFYMGVLILLGFILIWSIEPFIELVTQAYNITQDFLKDS